MAPWICVGLIVLGGCGPSAGPGSQDGGGTGSGSAGGESEEGGSESGESSSTTAPVDVCEALESSIPAPQVTITIVNDRATPAFIGLGGCGGTLPLTFTDAAGTVHRWQLGGDCFPEECSEFIARADCTVACADCEGVPPLRLDPGSVHTAIWSGGLYSEHELPPECVGGTPCSSPCMRLDQAAGRFDLSLTTWDTCTGECTCEVSGMGSACPTIDYHPQLAGELSAAAVLDYPAQTAISLSLQ
jgi:hypothetical protein